jgi:hypothetical protein
MAHMIEIPEPQETRAIAITAMSLAFGIILRLNAKGILTNVDVEQIFEEVLGNLEDFVQSKDPSVQFARVLLEQMQQLAVSQGGEP